MGAANRPIVALMDFDPQRKSTVTLNIGLHRADDFCALEEGVGIDSRKDYNCTAFTGCGMAALQVVCIYSNL